MAKGSVIAVVPSSSNPALSYEIRLGHDGNVYCSCPNWKYQKLPPKERTCKHMKELSAKIAEVTGKMAKAVPAKATTPAPAPAPAAAPAAPAPVAVSTSNEAEEIAALEAKLASLKAKKSAKVEAAKAAVEAAKKALAAAEYELAKLVA